ncbi:MAG: TonB-dependent receptor [Hyphomonadaceae bacterium]
MTTPFTFRLLASAGATLALCCSPAWAQGSGKSDTVVITGAIIQENAIDAFGSLTTVVSNEQVRDLNAVDLPSALRRTPGVVISRFNPVGSFGGEEGGAIYVRGLGASRPGSEVKTYIDGAPFYMGVWNHPLMDLVPVGGVSRIEVFKGPQPQQYGNTFAAINLTSRHNEPAGGDLRVSGGSFGTIVEQLNAAGQAGGMSWNVAQGYARSDGHRDDADGELFNAMGSVDFAIDPHWSAGMTALYVDNSVSDPGQQGLPATKQGEYQTQGLFLVASLRHDHDAVKGAVSVYTNQGDGNLLNQPGLDGDTLSHFELTGVRWTESWTPWAGGLLSGGIDYDTISGTVDFNRINPAPADRFDGPTLKLFMPHVALAQTIDLSNGWTLTPSVGVRFYDHSVMSEETAPHAGITLDSNGLELRANYSRGVVYAGLETAVLSQLIPALGTSWRDLKPETVDHTEIGAKFRPQAGTIIDVAVFNDELENRYIFGFPPLVTPPAFVNLGAYKVRGLEASLQQDLTADWNLFIGATLLDPSLDSLPYAPDHAIVVGLNGRVGDWKLGFDAQNQSSMLTLNQARAAGAANTQAVDGFTVVNARAAYPFQALGKRGEVFLALENITDANYEMRPGYPMPGASAQVGVNVSF